MQIDHSTATHYSVAYKTLHSCCLSHFVVTFVLSATMQFLAVVLLSLVSWLCTASAATQQQQQQVSSNNLINSFNAPEASKHKQESAQPSSVAHFWSDRTIFNPLNDNKPLADFDQTLTNNLHQLESIVVFTLPTSSGPALQSLISPASVSSSYHAFVQHYLTSSTSKYTAFNFDERDVEELRKLASGSATGGYTLHCTTPTSLAALNPQAFAYNQRADIIVVHIASAAVAQQCVTSVMSKLGSKYVVGVMARETEPKLTSASSLSLLNGAAATSETSATNSRKLLQSVIDTQYVSGESSNPQYPWSAANQPGVPLRNRQGPLYITPAILYGLMIGGFLLAVLYIGVSSLASIERPVRFATQTLQISKEY